MPENKLGTQVNSQNDRTIISRFLQIAEQHSTRPAVRFLDDGEWREWTYESLAGKALSIRSTLVEHGVQRGDAVGVDAIRHPNTIAALIAILSLGAHYVPLDRRQPKARLQMLIDDTGLRVLLTAAETDPFDDICHAVGLRGEFPDEPSDLHALADVATVHEEDVACVLFTSGSTGKPKGVRIPHRGPYNYVVGQDYFPLNETTAFLHLAPLSFDASMQEIWGSILNGGTCVVFPHDAAPTRDTLESATREAGVNTIFLTATLFNNVFASDRAFKAGIKIAMTGGEAASVQHFRLAALALPDARLFNGYGPTECSAMISSIRGFDVLVVDDDLNPVEQGSEGELLVFGDGVTLGYLNRPDLTAKSFVSIEGPNGQTRRGYRTGDKVRLRDDGELEFHGRFDDQVKIEGHRVEPSEIEHQLGRLDGVVACRVLAHKGPSAKIRLAAYVVCDDELLRQSLRQRAAEALPAHIVPKYWYFLDKLPINANGKLDRKALPDPFDELDVNAATGPGDVAGKVTTSWIRILETQPPTPSTNFFEAGGTSLDAVKLQEELCRTFDCQLSSTFVFEFPTIDRQVEVLRAQSTRTATTPNAQARRRNAGARRVRTRAR
jgi:amino acid adenylation domain-containing protein